MKLKDEMREAAAVEMERMDLTDTAKRVRAGEGGWAGNRLLNAALAPLDGYEEVEVQEVMEGDLQLLRMGGSPYWELGKPSFTVYRKKQEPAPDLKELAERAVKAWEQRRRDLDNHGCVYAKPMDDAMDALAEELDK